MNILITEHCSLSNLGLIPQKKSKTMLLQEKKKIVFDPLVTDYKDESRLVRVPTICCSKLKYMLLRPKSKAGEVTACW